MTGNRPWDGEASRRGDPPPHRPPRCHAKALDGRRGEVLLGEEESHHLLRVLRLDAGASVELFDGEGHWAEAMLAGRAGRRARLTIEKVHGEPPVRAELVLIQSLPKGQKQDLIIQKAVELGVSGLVFVESEHAVARLGESAERKTARWERIAVNAAAQCGRNRLPFLFAARSFSEALADRGERPRWLLLAEPAPPARPLRDVFGEAREAGVDRIAACIGPEGGFSAGERGIALAAGARPVSLGPHILRTETAALFVMAAWAYERS